MLYHRVMLYLVAKGSHKKSFLKRGGRGGGMGFSTKEFLYFFLFVAVLLTTAKALIGLFTKKYIFLRLSLDIMIERKNFCYMIALCN